MPFLVLLPLIENGDLMEPGQSTMSLLAALGPTALQARARYHQYAQPCLRRLARFRKWNARHGVGAAAPYAIGVHPAASMRPG